jgi:hypothetical protein
VGGIGNGKRARSKRSIAVEKPTPGTYPHDAQQDYSESPTILPERLWYGQVCEGLPVTAKWGEPEPKAGIYRGK